MVRKDYSLLYFLYAVKNSIDLNRFSSFKFLIDASRSNGTKKYVLFIDVTKNRETYKLTSQEASQVSIWTNQESSQPSIQTNQEGI